MDWVESNYSADTAMRFARSGALVKTVVAPGACEVCQALAGRVYLPSDVPRLPIRGCLHDRCNCTFVAVDPETEQTVPELVRWGARLVREGHGELARKILQKAVSLDERCETGWLWLSAVVDEETKTVCLEKVLAIDPHNERAAAGLQALRQGTERSTEEEAPARESAAEEQVDRQPVSSELTPHVTDIRQEREVILGQWRQFIGFAVNTDATTLLTQGRAFLAKLDALDEQALSKLVPKARAGEMRLQVQERDEMLDALSDMLLRYPPLEGPDAREMRDAIESLIRQLRERQATLQEQMSARG